jgi:hypothetical protein
MTLENENGISTPEINSARVECQELAMAAVEQYKVKPPVDSKKEIDRIERELKQIKATTTEKPALKSNDTPEAIAEVESLPLYNAKK